MVTPRTWSLLLAVLAILHHSKYIAAYRGVPLSGRLSHKSRICALEANKPPPALVEPDLPNTSSPQVNLTLSLSQLKPFLDIAVPFFKEDADGRNSLIGIGALTLLNSGVSVAFSYISRGAVL